MYTHTDIHICTYKHTHNTHIYINSHTLHVHIAYIPTNTHTYTHSHMYTLTNIHPYKHNTPINTYTYIHTQLNIYPFTPKHTHSHKKKGQEKSRNGHLIDPPGHSS